ncbi:MAG: hypothetical protein H6R15_499 [Proteobacteria bacterium]|nr:hypothetical protein [Pseudomonadota bacterium]
MSIDVANALASQVPAADWEKLAAKLNINVDVLKDKVASAYATIPTAPEPRLVVSEGVPADATGSWSQDFDFTIWEVIGMKGKVGLTVTTSESGEDDWVAHLEFTPVFFGIPVQTLAYDFGNHNIGYDWEYNFLNLAKLKIGYSANFEKDEKGDKYFNIHFRGTASYYNLFSGWQSASFDLLPIHIRIDA